SFLFLAVVSSVPSAFMQWLLPLPPLAKAGEAARASAASRAIFTEPSSLKRTRSVPRLGGGCKHALTVFGCRLDARPIHDRSIDSAPGIVGMVLAAFPGVAGCRPGLESAIRVDVQSAMGRIESCAASLPSSLRSP